MAHIEIDILNPENNESKSEEPERSKTAPHTTKVRRRLRKQVININGEIVDVEG